LAQRVLIIKTGRSETFAESSSSSPSLGDVLRTTVLLNAFAGDQVFFLTSKAAAPLLKHHPLLACLLTEDESIEQLPADLDTIVNLERSPQWVDFTAKAPAKRKLGFSASEQSFELAPGSNWQQGLFALIGRPWQGEDYGFHHPAAKTPEAHEIGLNWRVGPKWPQKSMSLEKWQELDRRLSLEHSVSWQRGFDQIEEYIAWIASCRTLITTDSLGLHLALAMKKNVIGLFGPTDDAQVHFYGRGRAIRAGAANRHCVDAISLDNVMEALREVQSPQRLRTRARADVTCEVATS
jgi:heptosyltransferase II